MFEYLLRRYKYEVNKFKILQLAKRMLNEKDYQRFILVVGAK